MHLDNVRLIRVVVELVDTPVDTFERVDVAFLIGEVVLPGGDVLDFESPLPPQPASRPESIVR